MCGIEDSENALYFREIRFDSNNITRYQLDDMYRQNSESFNKRNERIRKEYPYLNSILKDDGPCIISDFVGGEREFHEFECVHISSLIVCRKCFHNIGFVEIYGFEPYKFDNPVITGETHLIGLDMSIKELKLNEMNEEIMTMVSGCPIVMTAKLSYDVPKSVNISNEVYDAVIKIAKEISRYGVEGRRTGTSFIIGDTKSLIDCSEETVLNPFFGYDRETRKITNPDIWNSIKAYAQLDGAFIISNEGIVEAAGRLISVTSIIETLKKMNREIKGLGARHYSVAAITSMTPALGVVVSQSGHIKVFKKGKLCGEIEI
ncbi:MAG: diadenylate cyclase [Candidatus Methanoperedens sp.]